MTPQKLSHQDFRLGVSAFYVAHATMPLLFRHAVSHRQLQRILCYFHLIGTTKIIIIYFITMKNALNCLKTVNARCFARSFLNFQALGGGGEVGVEGAGLGDGFEGAAWRVGQEVLPQRLHL